MNNRKRNWGIVALILFVIAAGGFIYWQVSSVQPFKEEAKAAESMLEKWLAEREATPRKKQQAAPVEGNGAAPQKQSVDEMHPQTQGTAYEWQKLSGPELLEMAAKMRQVDVDALSPAEQAALEQAIQVAFDALPPAEQEAVKQAARAALWASRGLPPPPPGYTYGQNQDGYYLVKYGEPHFRVTWDNYQYGNDYLLSDTEYEEYKALDVIANFGLPGSRQPQATPEVVALAKDWYDALREKTWGPVPGLTAPTIWNRKATQADFDRINQLAFEKLSSLTPPPRSGVIDYDVVDRLLAELKAELERR